MTNWFGFILAGSREEWGDGLHPLQLCFGVVEFLVSLSSPHRFFSGWSVYACTGRFQFLSVGYQSSRNATVGRNYQMACFLVASRCASESVAGCRLSHPWAGVVWCWMLQRWRSSWVPWLLHCRIVAGRSFLTRNLLWCQNGNSTCRFLLLTAHT